MMKSLTGRNHGIITLYRIIIYVIIELVLVPMTSSICPTPCSCSNDDAGTRLDCRQRLLAAFIKPDDVPPDASEIDFGDNPVTALNRSSFPTSSRLKRLLMDNCRLRKLEKWLFQNLRMLEYLDLSRNQIQTIESGAFNSLTRLSELVLDYNWIAVLPGYVFRGLSLTRLGLRGNNMTGLPDELFELAKVAALDLDENHIPQLSGRCFKPLTTSLRSLSISRNRRSLVIDEDTFINHRLNSLTAVSSGITGAAFLNSLNAEDIDLSDNPLGTVTLANRNSWINLRLRNTNIRTLDARLLSQIGSVSLLDLSQNSIEQIPNNFGAYLPQLETLNLSRNSLKTFTNRTLSGFFVLSALDLSYNNFQLFPEAAVDVFEPITSVNLSGNPIHCNCEIRWLREWIGDSLRNLGSVRCASPIKGSMMNFAPSEFRCRVPVIISVNPSMNVREHKEVMLSCIANSDPASVGQWTSPSGGLVSTTPALNRTTYRINALLKLNTSSGHTGWYVCKASNVAGSAVAYTYVNVETSTSGPVDLSNLVYPRIPPPVRATTLAAKTDAPSPPTTTVLPFSTEALELSLSTTETPFMSPSSSTTTTTEPTTNFVAASEKLVDTDDLVISMSTESDDSNVDSIASTRHPVSSSSGTNITTNDAMSWQLIAIIVATSIGLALLILVVVAVLVCVYYRRTRRKYPVNDLCMVYLRFPLNGSLDKTTDSFQNHGTPSRNSESLLRQ